MLKIERHHSFLLTFVMYQILNESKKKKAIMYFIVTLLLLILQLMWPMSHAVLLPIYIEEKLSSNAPYYDYLR